MITVDQAFDLVAQQAFVLPPEEVRLQDSLGLVLASEVLSDIDAPPFDKSMMDGFAVAAGDSSKERIIIERIMAGDVPQRILIPGEATQVMTGAPVPEGAVAVVPVERTKEVSGDRVQIEWVDIPDGKHIQPRGSLQTVGKQVVPAGTRVTPQVIAAMAEAGAAKVQVVPRPTVSILITGNELVEVERHPSPGQIRNSNGPMLAALVAESQSSVRAMPNGSDDLEQLTQLVEQGLDADVLLVTGGVSAGVKDLVPQAFAAADVRQVFHKLALKPGKPLWFGVAQRDSGERTLVFGLPGNPVSGLACFHLFVRPVLDVLAGRQQKFEHRWLMASLTSGYSHPKGRESFRPAIIDDLGQLSLCDWQGSADLAGMVDANCLVRLPAEGVDLAPGSAVQVLPI